MTIYEILNMIMSDYNGAFNLDGATFSIYNRENGMVYEHDAQYTIVDDIREICDELGTDNMQAVSDIMDGFNKNDSELIEKACENGNFSAGLSDINIFIG